jgi:hypothetical protein
MAVIFSAELAPKYDLDFSFTPSNKVSRQHNIYEVWTGKHPKESWWYDWGGYNDIRVIGRMRLFIGGHNLVNVDTLEDCILTPYSIYDEPKPGMVYINVPMHTWLYDDETSGYRIIMTFTSGPKNDNPSDDLYYEEHWPVKLETPKLTAKLSDVVNGITKFSTFDFTIFNDDGFFDDAEAYNYFNSPTYIRKTWVNNPVPEDFVPIRYGIIESLKVDNKTIYASCADVFRTLEEPVSKTVKDLVAFDNIENANETVPVIYGTVKIKPIKISENAFIGGENINIVAAYNKDGVSVEYSFENPLIIYPPQHLGESQEAYEAREIETVLVTGNPNNRIGDIVVDLISLRTDITYVGSFWDLAETNSYRASSPRINILFNGGTVRNAVKNALSSDSVFLIQKNNGRFTLRKWGNTHQRHIIPSWNVTKFYSKDFSEAQTNYFSSCTIPYNYNFIDNVHDNISMFNMNEREAINRHHKNVRKTFETYLTNENDCIILAQQLFTRFSTFRSTVKVGIGIDTSNVNLLDTVELDLTINGRVFSKNKNWIVKEIDPSQDILTLEQL